LDIDSNGQGTVTLGKEINVGLATVGGAGVLKTDGSVGVQGKIGVGNTAVTAQGTVDVVTPYVWTWKAYLYAEYENAKQNVQGLSE
jgi:hypothetical protein